MAEAGEAEGALRFRFVSIAGSPAGQPLGTAMVTPMGANTSPANGPGMLSREVRLVPIELVSFGYSCGGAPRLCKRVINAGALAARATSPPAPPDAAAATVPPGQPWPDKPQIESLCSFLVHELQALAVAQSPSVPHHSQTSSPPLTPEPSAELSLPELSLSPAASPLSASPLSTTSSPPLSPHGTLLKFEPSGAPPRPAARPFTLPPAADQPAAPAPATIIGLSMMRPDGAAPPPTATVAADGATEVAASPTPPPRNGTSGGHAAAGVSPGLGSSASARTPGGASTPSSGGRPALELLRIGIGCKDGRTLSVAIVDHLADQLRSRGFDVACRHREVAREARRLRKMSAEAAAAQGEAPPRAGGGAAAVATSDAARRL